MHHDRRPRKRITVYSPDKLAAGGKPDKPKDKPAPIVEVWNGASRFFDKLRQK